MGGKVTATNTLFGSAFSGLVGAGDFGMGGGSQVRANQMANAAMNLQLAQAYHNQQQAMGATPFVALAGHRNPYANAAHPKPRVEVSAEDRKDFEADEMLRKAKEQGERLEAQFWHSVSTAR